jgi:regulator of cell morphogenesis and NO signaling
MRFIEQDADIGALAAEIPTAARVFIDHGINFCCVGPQSIDAACRDSREDAGRIIGKIEKIFFEQGTLQPVDGSVEGLVDFINDRYLRPLESKLSAVESLLGKVIQSHGPGLYGTREGVRLVFSNLASFLRDRLRQKEEVLFPSIVSGNAGAVRRTLHLMEEEEVHLSRHLERLSRLTSGFMTTSVMCAAEKALMSLLHELTTDLAAELHVEHHLLYPMALRE